MSLFTRTLDRFIRRMGLRAHAAPPKGQKAGYPDLYFHNTLSGEKERFTLPGRAKEVRMYNCGPTVYGVQHIGNLSMFVFTDVLRRALEYNGFPVKQVINFTDFGHLSGDNEGDADHGEDRMTKGLKREKMKVTMENMRILSDKYIDIFLRDIRMLHIDTGKIIFPRASDYVSAQIAMIRTLEEKGYTYRGAGGVYFDTSRFPEYGKLGNIDLKGLKEGARVSADDEKRNPTDFLLWKSDKKLGWESPWGKGFPGWHIECSAMINSVLGKQIDIHTGGIEHIPVHHNNEIAQSECATGKKPFSRFWMHRAHIRIEGGKIAKSTGAVIYLAEVIERGFHPLSLRYLFLGAHYRTALNFTWDSLAASEQAYSRLLALRLSCAGDADVHMEWKQKFLERINDDLDTPGAIAILWDMLKDENLTLEERVSTMIDFDSILGLDLQSPDDDAQALSKRGVKEYVAAEMISAEASNIMIRRDKARAEKNWIEADALREELELLGYGVDDKAEGQRLYKKN